MNCDTARILADNNDPRLEEHMLTCPSCAISAHADYYEAPPGLELKIRSALRAEIRQPAQWRWIAIAAAALLVASLVGNIALFRSRTNSQQIVADNVVAAHIRSLAGEHLLDVPSSDNHTVKPWFNGKLDFSPNVKEIEGFPLLGGRIEYFEGRPAAALIYGRRKHVINLFTWPSAKPASEIAQSHNGYQMQTWSADGMTYSAVSDLTQDELRQFVSLYRGLKP